VKSFKQFVAEALEKKSWRGAEKGERVNRLQAVTYTDKHRVSDVPVNVYYQKDIDLPKRSVNVDFDVNYMYHRPNPNSSGMMWRDYEKARTHLPSIMRHVKKSIETFAAEKKPNQLHMQPNDESKVRLYRTFANHLVKKHGGHVEEVVSGGIYKGLPKFIVHLPGKNK
jgi:hypothetical protein